MNNIEIGEKLKFYFEERGIPKEEIAKNLRSSTDFVERLYNGKSVGSLNARCLSKVYGFSAKWLMTGRGNMFIETSLSNTFPVYEEELFLEGKMDGFDLIDESEEINEYVSYPGLRVINGDFALYMKGYSMECDNPKRNIPNGSVVCLRECDTDFIDSGDTYAIATQNGYMIRRVRKVSDDRIVCEAYNGEYSDVELSIEDDVLGFAKVIGVITLHQA